MMVSKFSLFFLLLITKAATTLGEEITNNNSRKEHCGSDGRGCDGDEESETLMIDSMEQPVPLVRQQQRAPPARAPTGATRENLMPIKANKIWNSVVELQGDAPFGRVLDAGTGINSLNFVASLVEHGMTSYTAVTGSDHMHNEVQAEAREINITHMGEVIFGNWFDEKNPLRLDGTYDVILVDYLIGAMDAFSPYMQDAMLAKLVGYLNPGGRLYVVGLEPIPDYVDPKEGAHDTNSIPGANMICQVKHLRDSCVLLGGRRIYREFPRSWTERQFETLDEMAVTETRVFPRTWGHSSFAREANNGRRYLGAFISRELAEQMGKELDEIERQFSRELERVGRPIDFGSDYLVAAEKKKTERVEMHDEL